MSSRNLPETGTLTPSSTSTTPTPHRVGFIGLGHMGLPMAHALLRDRRTELRLFVQARTIARTAPLVEAGAHAVALPRDLAATVDTLLIMVPDLPQIRSVLAGADGVLAGISGPLTIVVMSSVDPDGVRALAADVQRESAGRATVIDAPVSGGTEGAAAGTLAIMVGADAASFARVRPVLAAMGTPVLLGPLGAGQVAKACNQMIVAATMTAIAEAAVIAERSGIDLGTLLPLLQGGYAGSRVLETKQAALIARDYAPQGAAGFMVKDLAAAASAARVTGTVTTQLDATRGVFDGLVAAGLGEDDLAVVHRYVAEAEPRADD